MIAKQPEFNDDLSDLIGSGPRQEIVNRAPADYKPAVERAFTEPCRKCGGSGLWRPGYPCFTCKGSGKQTFKQSAEKRAANRASHANSKAQKIEAFKAEYADVWAWMDGSTFGPAVEMRASLEKYGSLFDSRIEFARRMIAKRDEARTAAVAEKAQREAGAQEINAGALEAAFANAAKTNKRIALWIGTVRIAPAKPGSKWAGSLYVVDRGTDSYLGRVTAGKYVPSRDGAAREAEMLAILADPKGAAVKHGKLTGACAVCNRELTDANSVAAGIGPVCSEKMGW